jgi:hypothetical protein
MKLRSTIEKFMRGRYGFDNLGKFLNICSMLLIVMGLFLLPLFSYLAMLLLCLHMFRVLSYNYNKRAKENAIFVKLEYKAKGRIRLYKRKFQDRKTHRYYRCSSCKQSIRIPKGKGKIEITCPKCFHRFEKRS